VPGALLSMLGMSLLHEIVGYDKISKASEILEMLRKKFKQTLSKRDLDNTSDGMSISLCLLNKNTNELQYSGAFQSLIHIRYNSITKIKGANSIIGNYMHEVSYKNHIINLQKNDRIYLFTDGYADQMGDKNRGRFMKKRLLEQLLSFSDIRSIEQKTELNNKFENWRGNSEQIDDVLIMGVTV
jgi:serine phosphatase RsbU (regulator of sigma subunit)